MPTLKFEPESVNLLRERYPQALDRIFSASDIITGGESPGQFRRYVFDTDEGIRFVVSRDDYPGIGIQLHVSASLNQYIDNEETYAFKKYTDIFNSDLDIKTSIRDFISYCEGRFRNISGVTQNMNLLGFTLPRMVIHWFVQGE